MKIKLNPKQYDLLASFLHKKLDRCLFAMQMGTGKTICSLVKALVEKWPIIFIVCEPSLLNQWEQNYRWVFNDQNVEIWRKAGDENKILNFQILPRCIILTYDRFVKVLNLALERKAWYKEFFNIIFDESQKLKNDRTMISKTVLKANKNFLFKKISLLSGSLISNNFEQIYTQYALLQPLPQYTFYDFVNEFFTWDRFNKFSKRAILPPTIEQQQNFLTKFNQYCERIKLEDLTQINPLQIVEIDDEIKIDLRWLREQFYFDPEKKLGVFVNTPLLKKSFLKQALSGFLYLYELTPLECEILTTGRYELASDVPGIFDFTNREKVAVELNRHRIDMVNELLKNEQNYIIYYSFRYELELLKKYLLPNYKIFIINRDVDQREEYFNYDGLKVALISIHSHYKGIDGLQHTTHHLIYYSLPYSYEQFEQAYGRIYRMHQKENTYVYWLNTHRLDRDIFQRLSQSKDYHDLLFVTHFDWLKE